MFSSEQFYGGPVLPGAPLAMHTVLISYDGPRLYWMVTQDDRHVLVSNAEESDDYYIDLLRYCDAATKHAIDNKQLSLYDAYKRAPHGSVYLIRHPTKDGLDTLITHPEPQHISDTWLAEQNYFL